MELLSNQISEQKMIDHLLQLKNEENNVNNEIKELNNRKDNLLTQLSEIEINVEEKV